MEPYKSFKKRILKDKEIKKAYDELSPEFELEEMIIEKKIKSGKPNNQKPNSNIKQYN